MVNKFSPENGAPQDLAGANPNRQSRADQGKEAEPAAPAVRPIAVPHASAQQETGEATQNRVPPAAAATVNRTIVNPYAKTGNADPSAHLPDAFRMMMDPKYREFHTRPVSTNKPPIPYPGTKTDRPSEHDEQFFLSSGTDPKSTMKKYMKDAYFKVDGYNYVTAEKHKELFQSNNSKIRPQADPLALNTVLLSDKTRTMLVSPQKLADVDEEYAAKKFKQYNIGQKAIDADQAGKNRHEILVLSPKSDQISALPSQPGNKKYKSHQILVAVDDDQGRHYVDLRAMIADKQAPAISKDAQSKLRKIVEPETLKQLSQLTADQPALNAGAKRPNTTPDTARTKEDTPEASRPEKRSKSGLDERSRERTQDRSL